MSGSSEQMDVALPAHFEPREHAPGMVEEFERRRRIVMTSWHRLDAVVRYNLGPSHRASSCTDEALRAVETMLAENLAVVRALLAGK